MQYLDQVVDALLENNLRRATKFVSPTKVINAHRIVYGNPKTKKVDRRLAVIDIRLKIGAPNFHERKFIKDCIKAGEPFPVKKIKFVRFRGDK